MSCFVIAKFSAFNNELVQKIMYCENLDTAYWNQAISDEMVDRDDESISIEEIKQRYFDCDSMINIIGPLAQ